MTEITEYYRDYIVKLKNKPLKEVERQIAHHFANRSISSTDLYELNVEEFKRRERLEEKREIMKWTKWTFFVALIAVVLSIAQIIVQLNSFQ
jgi:hypothetical protein